MAEPTKIEIHSDTTTPRLNRLMNDPSVVGFRMRATGAPPDLTSAGGQTASGCLGGPVNHVREDLHDTRLADLHGQTQAPLESERGPESHGQRLHQSGLQQDETEGVLRQETQVAGGRVGYVGDVGAVDVEDHEGQVVRA